VTIKLFHVHAENFIIDLNPDTANKYKLDT